MNNKGFGKSIVTEKCQTFRVEYKSFNIETGEEEDIENRFLKVPLRKGDAMTRRHIVAAWVSCFLQSPEAEQKKINLAFLWNSEEAAKEPLGVFATFEFTNAIQLPKEDGINPYKALKFLSKTAVKSV